MTQPFVDVSVRGQRARLPLSRFDFGDLSSSAEIRTAVERVLGLRPGALHGCVVLRIGPHVWIRVPVAVRMREVAVALARGLARASAVPVRGLARLAAVCIAAAVRMSAPFERIVAAAVTRIVRAAVVHAAQAWTYITSWVMRALEPVSRVVAHVVQANVAAITHVVDTATNRVAHAVRAAFCCMAHVVVAVLHRVEQALETVVGHIEHAVEGVFDRVAHVVHAAFRCVARVVEAVFDRVARDLDAVVGRVAAGMRRCRNAVVAVVRSIRRFTVAVNAVGSRMAAGIRRRRDAVAAAAVRITWPLRRRVREVVALVRAWWFGVADRILTGRDAAAREQDHRRALFDALLSSPHRDLGGLHPAHAELCRRDPFFYVRLAAWYAVRGEGRDHLEMFVIVLVTSEHAEHREVGLAILRALPPYQVGRVVDFIRGRVVRRGRATVREGLFRNPSRALRTEVERFLREREASPDAFDGSVLAARAAVKRLYTTLHIRPSARAQATLFDRDPPADGRVAALRRAVQTTDPDERARIVREARLPYRVAASLLPASSDALVERMSAAEVVNHMALLERRGALDDASTRHTVERRLQEAVTSRRVSTMRSARAAEAVDGAWAARLRELTEQRVRAHGRLRQATAVLVDASASMDVALDVGRRIAAMLAVAADAPLHVYAFSDRVRPVVPSTADMTGWIQAFDGIAAEGATSPGAAVLALLRAGHAVEQIVLITDQRENASPRFVPALRLYRRRRGARDLRVVFVNVGDAVDTLERACGRLHMEVASWRFRGDDYAIPDLLPLIVAPTRTQLVIDILGTPLPARRAG